MKIESSAVIGLGFGDEGKGSFTSYLCSKSNNPLVVRFSGGHQAGHTVEYNGKRHVFSNFGSGTLNGATTYWSKFCTLDPIGLLNEYEVLKSIGINPIIYIDNKCPVVTPMDKYKNIFCLYNKKHGTCGVGFGKTIEREENNYHLLFEDLFFKDVLKEKFRLILSEYYENKFLDLSWHSFEADFEKLLDLEIIKSFNSEDFDVLKNDHEIIFEGSQGLLLDKDIGFFPNVTRSNTDTTNIKYYEKELGEIYLITRAYQTRHGNGFMTNKHIPHNIKINNNETNILNEHQGEFRRSLLDLNLLEYGINKDYNIVKNQNKTLVITCLDHIEDDLRFTYRNEIVKCKNIKQFTERIANILDISSVLINDSPNSKNFRLI